MDAAELAFAGAARQAELIRDGEISSRELTTALLERIDRLDRRLNAFRVVFAERALTEAEQADGRRGAGGERPLLGVPVAIKDDMDVAGEVTARGTSAHGGPATADAEAVRRLRAAGAVVIGKTNVPELTIHGFTESATFGYTRNPWDLDRTPGGSSGGSAAAVAAGLVGAATASDGAGSIRIPAACCGLFGLKPQRDRVPVDPHGGRWTWNGLTVFGTVTRSVRDATLLYDVLREGGPSFAEAAAQPPGRLRIAFSTKVPQPIMAKADAGQRGALDQTVALLRSLGHEVVERDPDYGGAVFGLIARYLRGTYDEANGMPHPERLERRTRGYVRMGAAVTPMVLNRVLAAEADHRERIARSLEGFDLLLTPMFTRLPPRVGEYEGRPALWCFNGEARWTPYTAAWNHTGQPAMAVPAGFTPEGFPLAVQFVGPPDGEPVLLSLAAQLEAERPWADRRPPVA